MDEIEVRLRAVELAARHIGHVPKWQLLGMADSIVKWVYKEEPTPKEPPFTPMQYSTSAKKGFFK